MALKRLVGGELVLRGEALAPLEQVLPPEAAGYVLGFYVVCAQQQPADEDRADGFADVLRAFCAARKPEDKPRLEVLVVSLEEDEQPFLDSVRDLPWPALPRSASHKKMRLLRRLRAKGLAPTLALVEMPSGRLITSATRERLLQHPEKFPWHPRPLREALKDIELSGDGKTRNYDDLKGIKGFYFSANWCPPCKAFTPQLIETYQRVRERGCQFDVIFISSDRSETSFEQYKCSMPWLSIPFEMDDLRKELASTLDVQGIPSLVLVDAQDRIITDEARQEICEDPAGQYFPWPERRIYQLTDRTLLRMHDRPAVILLVECEEELAFAESVLLPAAQNYWQSLRESSPLHLEEEEVENELQFFVGYDSDTADTVREFAGLEDWVPLLVVLEVFNQRVATLAEGVEVTADSAAHFVAQFFKGQTQWTELGAEQQQQAATAVIQSCSPSAKCSS